jgi:prepilin-type processing-associated H-X9-DG protein
MSTITRGYTLTDGLIFNYNFTTLHALVDSAAVTNIALTEFATTAHLVQVSASQPGSDQGDGSLWYDSALGMLRVKYDDSSFGCPYVGPALYNPAGTIPRGAWVAMSGNGTVSMCATGMWPECIGVAVATMVSGAFGLIRTKGIGQALVIGPTTVGDVLISGGHAIFAFGDGHARSFHSTGISSATLGIELGIVFGQVSSGTTGLATCIIWR